MALGVWHMKMIDKIHDRLLVSLLSEIKKWVYFVTNKIVTTDTQREGLLLSVV